MTVDPYILAFSAATVVATIWMGFWSARKSRTASDFFVAGRSVSVGWNASAISGEYLSAASFMGVAGMVMSSGYDALWYPVCYACGYLFLLLFIAGPLRRFGAYTIPDFAEGRFDSPVFRKIAVVFVLFIGFFYTMPQMKGAGTTLAYIFPGLPYWAGVVLVGAVITLNVALGGMKGITLVQAFQYWLKMFAISAPIFVLMAVYGHYGKHLGANPVGNEIKPTFERIHEPPSELQLKARDLVGDRVADAARLDAPGYVGFRMPDGTITLLGLLKNYGLFQQKEVYVAAGGQDLLQLVAFTTNHVSRTNYLDIAKPLILENGFKIVHEDALMVKFARSNFLVESAATQVTQQRKPLPAKAPSDHTWISPFGPLTTKAAKAAAAALTNDRPITLRPDLLPEHRMTVALEGLSVRQALLIYADITGREFLPRTNVSERLDQLLNGTLSRLNLVTKKPQPDSGVFVHGDGLHLASDVKETVEQFFAKNGFAVIPEGNRFLRLEARTDPGAKAKEWLDNYERPLALLYTYSLIVALVCGTAGLPHILVRFYTNPDGVAAKRTTMWVMILIGVFYVFPPVFGVLGRNLLPDLYAATGAKGTDKIVLELPRILNHRYAPLGSILSGIACAGAFAAFMSTFSGLLVSMTGAMAHDVYGRILRPKSTPQERMRAFKVAAVVIGAVAVVLGMQVEPLQINFMVGQAFAIAAASYFPLLFMSAWWRGMTVKGAAAGMLMGGLLALAGISLTSFTDLGWIALQPFWASFPLLRILCEQPAIWTVPLAIATMVLVSRATRRDIPGDARMKMLVLHAPEKLGLKQEYIQEHQGGH